MKMDKCQEIQEKYAQKIQSVLKGLVPDGEKLFWGEGNLDGTLMFVAEYVSEKEVETGQSFLEVERRKLYKFLSAIKVEKEAVYQSHLLKYRPTQRNREGVVVSRVGTQEEYDLSMPYLKQEIDLVRPKLIVTLGNKMLQQLIGDETLVVLPSEDQLFLVNVQGKNYKVLPLPHPSQKHFALDLEKILDREKERLQEILHINQEKETEVERCVPETQVDEICADETAVKETPKDKKRIFKKIRLKEKEEDKVVAEKGVVLIYGGEGYVDDPVIVAMERVSHVLTELGGTIHRVDLYQSQDSMETILGYIQRSIGVVLAVNVEWFGVGYRMQQFLDQCFYRGEKNIFKNCPMLGLVISRRAYEYEGYEHLLKSWECLGGVEGGHILASIETAATLETNFEWIFGIDKKTEDFYRRIHQKKGRLPRSQGLEKVFVEVPVETVVERNVTTKVIEGNESGVKPKGIIENYDTYIEKQQEDIHQLGNLFKKKLAVTTAKQEEIWPERLKNSYVFKGEIDAKIQIIVVDDYRENTVVELKNRNIRCYYGQIGEGNVIIKGKKSVLKRIIDGKLTMQRGFMSGEIKAQGDFTLLYRFEEMFDL